MATMREMGDYTELEELVKHHIDSYDYMVERGLEIMLDNIKPVKIHDSFTDTTLSLFLSNPRLYEPHKEQSSKTKRSALFPFECRQSKISYTGRFEANVCFQYNGRLAIRERFNFGQIPIMLKSKLCHLRSADPQKLVSLKEECTEMGGMAEAKERNLIPAVASDMQAVLKRCENLEKEVRSLKLNLSFLNRKDSEQTKQMEELQKQNEELVGERERLLEEIEGILSRTGKM